MEDEPMVATFVSITGAEADVALHYLEACNWDLDRAVDEYLDNSQSHTDHIPPPQPGEAYRTFPEDGDTGRNAPVAEGENMEIDDMGSNDSFHTPTHSVSPTDMENTPQRGARTQNLFDELPEGFGRSDLHEAQMLEAALLGIPFAGDLSEMMPPIERPPPRPASPSTIAAREIREQQDFEYEESQRRDREKREAAAEQERRQMEAQVFEAQRKQQEADSITKVLQKKSEALSVEPQESHPDSIMVVIRFPDGARRSRRFLKSNPVSALFNFVDVEVNRNTLDQGSSEGASANRASTWWKLGGYDLVTQFPRRVMKEETTFSLEAAGLTNRQETLFVEMK